MLSGALRVRRAQLERLGIEATEAELALHQSIGTWQFEATEAYLHASGAWLRRLQTANGEARIYPEPHLSRALGARWYAVCRAASRLGRTALTTYLRSPLSRFTRLSLASRIRFEAACYLRSRRRRA
jgi:hypothetical protein